MPTDAPASSPAKRASIACTSPKPSATKAAATHGSSAATTSQLGSTISSHTSRAANIFSIPSRSSSCYNGVTLSIDRRVARGSYARLSYTYAPAIDDGQDALVADQPATVENSYNPSAERGPSVTASAWSPPFPPSRTRFIVARSFSAKSLTIGNFQRRQLRQRTPLQCHRRRRSQPGR